MATTNGIKHKLRKGQYVQNINYVGESVFVIVNVTEKRIVVRHVGFLTGNGIELDGRNHNNSNMTVENIILLDSHIPVIQPVKK